MTAAVLVDLVLAALVVEFAALLVFGRRRRWSARRLLPNLAAGAFLVLALRVAVHGQGIAPMGLFLAAAGVAHLLDLRRRAA